MHTLTDIERLLLANQYEILALLKQDDDYSRMAENLRDGHKWLYDQNATQISENLSDEETNHVLAILDLYSNLYGSYEDLTDKTGITKDLVNFPGFDGNNEAELLHFSRALTKSRRYTETIGAEAKNSHMPTTAKYQRMIEEWESMGKPSYPLSKEQIKQIVQVKAY